MRSPFRIRVVSGPSLGLPVYPGEVVVYAADATNGVEWMFRHSGDSSAYQWRCIGGSALSVEDLNQQGPTSLSATTWSDISSALAVTVPLAGDYDTQIMASEYNNTGSSSELQIGLKIGATEPVSGATGGALVGVVTANTWHSMASQRKASGVAASTVLTLRFWQTVTGNVYRRNASLRVTPVRCA